ncbi:MAG: diaminopimelate decarboxylase [Solirubrobacteraceae bacterium]|nr:diaminopimelate decarboxylase [Solirubrobacteraceae bacterium]
MLRNQSGPMTRIDDALSIRGGRLFIEECDAAELAARFGTPLYVTSEDQLLRNLQRLRQAFGRHWPGDLHVLPSIKANASLAVRRILTNADAGCDAFGPAELEAALRGGVRPKRISLNGPTKGLTLLERAVGLGVRVTVDSVEELERTVEAARRAGRRATVRLRVRPDYRALRSPSQLMPEEGSIHAAAAAYKAGIPTEDLLALAPADLARPELDISGFMVHLGRHDAQPESWAGMATAFVEVLSQLLGVWSSLEVRELDIGGGYPVPRDPFGRAGEPALEDLGPRAFSLDTYAGAIVPVIADGVRALGLRPERIALEIEPGRALFGDAGVHLTRVRNIKRETAPFVHTWVETDSSDAWLADVVLERNRWATILADRADSERTELVQVVGTTCAPDVIVANEPMPPIEVGDTIVVLDTGAYQETSASNFNSLPRPATVLVHGDSAELIRRAETIDDVFAREILPARLAPDGVAATGASGGVKRLDHVSVTSGDLERSLRFYRDLLGLVLRDRGEMSHGELAEITGMSAARVRWADLHLPNQQVLELLEYVSPKGVPVTKADNDPGSTHMALRVDDIDAFHARLVAAGVPVRSSPVTLDDPDDWNGARCFYASDPDGVTVELIEWAHDAARVRGG